MRGAYPVAVAATSSVTRITAFVVPPEADDEFLAGRGEATLHRALRPDAEFRFVAVGGRHPPESRFDAHTSDYEMLREVGTPDVAGGVALIDLFEVPDDQDERFLEGWERMREALAQQRGYLGTRLHRSLAPADFRFVDVARWSSPLMFARALKLADVEQAIEAMPFRSHPALYSVVGD
jgi:heme-degrading monooxygenase HmoA